MDENEEEEENVYVACASTMYWLSRTNFFKFKCVVTDTFFVYEDYFVHVF
jgi:hypothetical protein